MAQSDTGSVLPGFMPARLPENAPAADFDAVAIAKALLRMTRAAALATIDRNTGHPFGSLVNVATDVDGSPLILISRLATHTANLEKDARASLLLASAGKGDPLAHPRLTVLGAFVPGRSSRPFRAAPAPALPGASSQIGALCGLCRLLVLAAWRRVGSPERRLRSGRRPESREPDDRHCRRAESDRSRGRRVGAHERRPCRGNPALCDQAPWCRRWPMAAHRS